MSAGCFHYLTLALAADLPPAKIPKVHDSRLTTYFAVDSLDIATPREVAVTAQDARDLFAFLLQKPPGKP